MQELWGMRNTPLFPWLSGPLESGAVVTYWVLNMGEIDSVFVWVLWHIKLRRLLNAKSMFIQINSSFSNNSV